MYSVNAECGVSPSAGARDHLSPESLTFSRTNCIFPAMEDSKHNELNRLGLFPDAK